MAEVVSRRQAEKHIQIGQPEVRIQYDNLLAQFRQANRQIGNHVGFADTAFSAGYRHNLGSLVLRPEGQILWNPQACASRVFDSELPAALVSR